MRGTDILLKLGSGGVRCLDFELLAMIQRAGFESCSSKKMLNYKTFVLHWHCNEETYITRIQGLLEVLC